MTPINADPGSLEHVIQNHLRLVYSAALRQTRDTHLAEDATQAVFILFMRKRHSIPAEHVAGWLIKAAYFTSKEAMRAARRRQHYEQQAAMNKHESSSDIAMTLAPALDEALAKLATRARSALALRYLECRSVGDVADILGVSENAATKIISRGIAKLRRILSAKDFDFALTPTSVITALAEIGTKSQSLNLDHFAHTISLQSIGAAPGSSALAHATAKFLFWTKIQIALASAATAAFIAVVGVVAAHELTMPQKTLPQLVSLPTTLNGATPLPGVVIRDFGYRLGSSIELSIPSSTNNSPVSTFISLHGQRVVFPPVGLTWNPLAPLPFNPTMDKWLQDNDIALLIVARGQNVHIFGIRANYVPAATSPETTTADIVESVMKKTSRWNVNFPEAIALPFDFYVQDYAEHFAVAELSANIKSHGSYVFHYRLIEPDPTSAQDEHLALADSEFLYARAYSNPTRAGLRITVAGDRLRQLGKTDHYYTGGLFLNGQLLTIGWFDLGDRSFTSDIFGTIDATPQRAQAIAQQLNQATPDNGYKRFIRLYSLNSGQALRHIPPPFPPERQYAMWPVPISPNGLIICNFQNGEPTAHLYTFTNHAEKLQLLPLADIFNDVAGLQNYDFVVDPTLLQINLSGDFVVDPSAKAEAKLAALQQIISAEMGRKIRIVKTMMKRSVIVALGHYDFTPLPESNHSDAIAITATTNNMASREQESGSDSWQDMLDLTSNYIGMRIINMAENPPNHVKWANYASTWTTYNRAAQTTDSKQLNALLQLLSAQTNLDFKIETRSEEVYMISPD